MPNYSGKKNWSLIHCLSRFLAPQKRAFPPTLGKTLLKRCNLKTLWSKVSFFFIALIFLWKNLKWVENDFFYKYWERKLKLFLEIIFFVCLKGALLTLQTHYNFFPPYFFFFFNIYRKYICNQQRIFHKNVHVIKKTETLTARSSNCSVFPNVGRNPLFWRGH